VEMPPPTPPKNDRRQHLHQQSSLWQRVCALISFLPCVQRRPRKDPRTVQAVTPGRKAYTPSPLKMAEDARRAKAHGKRVVFKETSLERVFSKGSPPSDVASAADHIVPTEKPLTGARGAFREVLYGWMRKEGREIHI
jgi:hypothetical protein